MKKVIVFALMLVATTVFASDFNMQSSLTKGQFRDLVSELALAATPTPSSPAEPLGTLGFDIAVETSLTEINGDSAEWKNSWNDADDYIYTTRLHAQKGLPFGFDIGASITKGGNVDFTAFTLELKYAILEGTVVTPAISTKIAYTNVSNLEGLDIQSGTAGIYISKGILILTPYAGVEDVLAYASEHDRSVNFDSIYVNNVRGMVGLQVCPFPFIVLNAELSKSTDSTTQYGLKAAIRF